MPSFVLVIPLLNAVFVYRCLLFDVGICRRLLSAVSCPLSVDRCCSMLYIIDCSFLWLLLLDVTMAKTDDGKNDDGLVSAGEDAVVVAICCYCCRGFRRFDISCLAVALFYGFCP